MENEDSPEGALRLDGIGKGNELTKGNMQLIPLKRVPSSWFRGGIV
jgi:hypothetical protein